MPSKKPFRRKKSQHDVYVRSYVREYVDDDAAELTQPVRLNFSWHTPRLMKVKQAAKRMDITFEAFLRFAAYEQAVKVLSEEAPEAIEYERQLDVISHRHIDYEWEHRFRTDWVPQNWRWRKHSLDVVKEAAKATQCDYRTFIDYAAYEKAVEIAGPENVR
jgi:hypothetical protein